MNESVGKFARCVALLQSYDMDKKFRPGGWDELPAFECISGNIEAENVREQKSNTANTETTCTAAVVNEKNFPLSIDNIRKHQNKDTRYKHLIAYLKDQS